MIVLTNIDINNVNRPPWRVPWAELLSISPFFTCSDKRLWKPLLVNPSWPIYNDNRLGWSPIQSVVIRVINKIGQPWRGSPICQSQVWLQTELDNKKSCEPINYNCYNFWKQQIHLGQISLVETMSKVKKFLHFGNSSIFFRISDCCYGYCDQFCDWWIWLSGVSIIGYFNCPVTANGLVTLSNYSSTEWLVKNKAAYAPITFEEIVMVMINVINLYPTDATSQFLQKLTLIYIGVFSLIKSGNIYIKFICICCFFFFWFFSLLYFMAGEKNLWKL